MGSRSSKMTPQMPEAAAYEGGSVLERSANGRRVPLPLDAGLA